MHSLLIVYLHEVDIEIKLIIGTVLKKPRNILANPHMCENLSIHKDIHPLHALILGLRESFFCMYHWGVFFTRKVCA